MLNQMASKVIFPFGFIRTMGALVVGLFSTFESFVSVQVFLVFVSLRTGITFKR